MTNREHDVLEAVSKTIREYDEDTIIEVFRKILDRFDYEVLRRDPGPDEDVESGNVWPREGDMARLEREHDIDLMERAFPGQVINMTGRIL